MFITLRTARSRWKKGQRSYSQEGEDLILARLIDDTSQGTGFYVDVGALDPMRFSNTYLFYRRGWRGVNIDATPCSMRLFDKYRPRDVNIETGIGSMTTRIPFYIFNDPALNTFDEEIARRHNKDPYKIERVIDVRVSPLRDVLIGHLPRGTGPSFLNIDAEGRDLDVLRSNDWPAFRPTYVLAECLAPTIDQATNGPVSKYMSSVGYHFIAKTVNTAFFQSTE